VDARRSWWNIGPVGLRTLAIRVVSCWSGQEAEALDAGPGIHRRDRFTSAERMRRKRSKVAASGLIPSNHRCERDRRELIDSLYDCCEIGRIGFCGLDERIIANALIEAMAVTRTNFYERKRGLQRICFVENLVIQP